MIANLLLASLLLSYIAWTLFHLSPAAWLSAEAIVFIATMPALVVLTLRRPAPTNTDVRWWVWVLCVSSTFYVFLFEENPIEAIWWAHAAYWGRLTLQIGALLALLSLGRSFALMPALRAIQTDYFYRWIRHPVYAFYMAADLAFLALQFSWWNMTLVCAGALMYIARASVEEKLLSEDAAYKDYMLRVPHRFVPGVW